MRKTHLLTSLFVIFTVSFSSITPLFAQESVTPFKPQVLSATDQNEEYAPDRIIVKYKEGQSKRDITVKVVDRAQERSTLFGNIRQKTTDAIIYGSGDRPEDRLVEMVQVEKSLGVETEPIAENIVEGLVVAEQTDPGDLDVEKAIEEFESLPEVEYAEPDYARVLSLTPNDEYYPWQWGIVQSKTDFAWDVSLGGSSSDFYIAILDSGISDTHPEFSGRIIGKYDCSISSACVSGGSDNYGHGTAVAGVVAAIPNNSVGVAGSGYNSRFISYKVSGSDNMVYTSYVLSALDHLLANYPNKKIIINMSFGGASNSSLEDQAMQSAYSSGLLLVAAAGNSNSSAIEYPGGYSSVLSVAALSPSSAKASYSNYGTWIDLAAAGGDCDPNVYQPDCIITTGYDSSTGTNTYVAAQGTSFASPLVAGIASLVWSKSPSLSNSQVRSLLVTTATPISGTNVYWSNGLVNAQAAVQAASGPTHTPTPTLSPTPTQTPTPSIQPTKSGDTDGDDDVDISDLSTLLATFGSTGSGLSADFDGDGDVDISDLSTLLANFGN